MQHRFGLDVLVAERVGNRFAGDLAGRDVQAILEMRIVSKRFLPALVGEREHKGQGSVVERERGGTRHPSGHVGDTIMNHSVDDIGRIRVRCRVRRLEAAALVYRHVDDHRTLLHLFHQRRGHELRRERTRNQNPADDEVGGGDMVLDRIVGRKHGVERPAELAPKRAQHFGAAIEHPDIRAHSQRDVTGMRSDDAAAEDDDFGGIDTGHPAQKDAQAAMCLLQKIGAGLGVLLGGVPGVDPAKVVILGGGVVGSHACHIALGMGADVWVLDRSTEVLRALWRQFGRPLNTVFSTHAAIDHHVTTADLVVGGGLIPGAFAPKLVSAALVKRMKKGSVIVDVAIDQGGCFETSHPTTHADPTYVVDGVIHYCVANMPGGVPRTSTFALNNATLPFVLALADKGWKKALADDVHLKNGLNVASGKVTCKPVADALGYEYIEPESMLH